jgi:hypothetical protein
MARQPKCHKWEKLSNSCSMTSNIGKLKSNHKFSFVLISSKTKKLGIRTLGEASGLSTQSRKTNRANCLERDRILFFFKSHQSLELRLLLRFSAHKVYKMLGAIMLRDDIIIQWTFLYLSGNAVVDCGNYSLLSPLRSDLFKLSLYLLSVQN